MTSPIDTLMTEHRFIEKVLEALAGYARRLDSGDPPREDLARFVDLLRNFADACHHGKEEGVLFPAMVAHGVPRDGGPIGVMLHEHELGRAEIRALAGVAEGEGPLTDAEKGAVTRASTAYVELLHAHIEKEDRILYPMALEVLPESAWRDIAERFSLFEEEETGPGEHERLHALGEALVGEYGRE